MPFWIVWAELIRLRWFPRLLLAPTPPCIRPLSLSAPFSPLLKVPHGRLPLARSARGFPTEVLARGDTLAPLSLPAVNCAPAACRCAVEATTEEK